MGLLGRLCAFLGQRVDIFVFVSACSCDCFIRGDRYAYGCQVVSSDGQIRHTQGGDSSRILFCTVSSSVAELSVVGFYHSVMFLPV